MWLNVRLLQDYFVTIPKLEINLLEVITNETMQNFRENTSTHPSHQI